MSFEEAVALVNWGCILTRPGVDGFLSRGDLPVFLSFTNDSYRQLTLADMLASDWYVLGDFTDDIEIDFVWE